MTHASKRCWLPPRNECPLKRCRLRTRLRRATEKTRADPPTRKAWREPSLGEEERGSSGSPIRQTSNAQRPMRGRKKKGTRFRGGNSSWVRLSNCDRAGNKRDGRQFCFHVFVSLLLLTVCLYNLT